MSRLRRDGAVPLLSALTGEAAALLSDSELGEWSAHRYLTQNYPPLVPNACDLVRTRSAGAVNLLSRGL